MSDDDGFIGLPPGILPPSIDADSGTVRRDRPDRPRTAEPDEIVFFPVVPGLPAPIVPESPPVAPADEPVVPEDEPTDVPASERVPEDVAPTPAAPLAPSHETTEPLDGLPLEPVDDATRVSSARRRSAPVWRLLIPGQGSVPVEGVLYLGRNPVAGAGHPGAHVLSVDDSAKSVSKTHAMLEVDAGALWVHDLDSTNGVWVVPQGEDAIEVLPGERVLVPAGSDLELGDLVVQVEHG